MNAAVPGAALDAADPAVPAPGSAASRSLGARPVRAPRGTRLTARSWQGVGVRHRAGLAFNEMVRRGELRAPIVFGRDHLDPGSVASPIHDTEAMRDGSDAAADWPLLNAMLNVASGATWVSIHQGGGVGVGVGIGIGIGIGYSRHSGVVIVCDGTEAADVRLSRVLWNDPATGVMPHSDAAYEDAIECAQQHGLDLPMIVPGGAGR